MSDLPIYKGATPSLRPEVIEGIEGHSKFGHKVKYVPRAFERMYEGSGKTNLVRENLRGIETLTDVQKTLEIAKVGKKHHDNAVALCLTLRGGLTDQIESLKKSLSKPLAMPSTALGAEIRSHYKNLSNADRMAELMAAINAGDATTAHAVLGGPAYLSGLSVEDQKLYTRTFHERNQPELSGELEFTEKVLAVVERTGRFIDQEFAKAMGADSSEVRRVRDDDARATLALAAAQ